MNRAILTPARPTTGRTAVLGGVAVMSEACELIQRLSGVSARGSERSEES
ncbi:hypothetical protein IW245_005195 [Longispora fulva]|uniref:Uncharacterized protein n=1 Tax=Longispora fulva TaxID=619741 RepID=A0A8J7GJ06_9ACTN|nr:hypothetical protein [Longispora fulva]